MSERRDDDAPERDDVPEDDVPEDDVPEDDVPEDDAPEQDAPEQDDSPAGGGEEPADVPEPATWAGRQGWSGLPDEPEGAPGEEGSGLTEEFDEVEREFADDLAGEFESPVADGEDEIGDEDLDEEDLDEDEDFDEEDDIDPDEELAGDAVADHTVESDTPVLAEQEEAREAALAGLKARTAEHAAKRGVPDPGQGAPTPEPAAIRADQEKPPGRGLWARFLTASFLIVVSMATATSVSLLVYLTDIAKGLGGLEGLSGQLDAIDEKAQNFLILGSDVRPGEGQRGRSDTTMLLRVDPDKHLISQLSIPRDLEVNIPGHGIDKFNAAYTYGGPKLTLKVVKQLTGDRVAINHAVNVDFNGFADAVDAIDCVYIDVDRHYFNDNSTASFADQYAVIDIEAGYQRLCGLKALQYVRYRHEDNDIVRAARQQTFLREARQKVPPTKLLQDRDELIDIFKQYTTSDIRDVATLVELFKLMLDARDAQINQVEFPVASLGNEQGYVTANTGPIRAAVSDFLGEGISAPTPPAANSGGDGGSDGGKPAGGEPKPKPSPEPKPAPAPAADLIDSTGSGQQYSTVLAQDADKEIKFPILYPTRLAPGSTISDSDTRWFRIDGPGNDIYRGYKFVVSMPGTSYPTAYYGVSGTDWLNAPLFENPSEEREINGRPYKLYYDAGRLRMVAFQRDKAMYWVTNTLDKLMTNEQMLGIAQNLAVPGG